MNDPSSITGMVLSALVAYGPIALALALFLGAIGMPVPGTILLIAAGAFIRQGVFSMATAIILGFTGTVLGDSVSYGMGRFAGSWALHRFGRSAPWTAASQVLVRRGDLAVYLTRFLFMPLAVPLNLIAGSSNYPYSRYLMFDIVGEITWFALYGGLGYIFGSQWELISQFVSDSVGLLAGFAILAIGAYWLIRLWKSTTRTPTHKVRDKDKDLLKQ